MIGTRPLGEVVPRSVADVPRAGSHGRLAGARVTADELRDEDRPDRARARAHAVHERSEEVAEEIRSFGHVAEPPSVLTVRPGRDEPRSAGRGDRPGVHHRLADKPLGVETAFLRVRYPAVAGDHGDLRSVLPRDVRPVRIGRDAFFNGLDVDSVDDDVLVPRLRERGDHLHVERHLGGPEPLGLSSEDLGGELPSRNQMIFPILPRYQRENGVEVPHPDGLDVSRLPVALEHRGDVDELPVSVDDLLRPELLEKDPREPDMKPRDILELMGVPRRPVVTTNDLLGFPRVFLDEQPEVARRLVHVEPQRVKNGSGRIVSFAAARIHKGHLVRHRPPFRIGQSVALKDDVVSPAAGT
jgi:hypothetical protein